MHVIENVRFVDAHRYMLNIRCSITVHIIEVVAEIKRRVGKATAGVRLERGQDGGVLLAEIAGDQVRVPLLLIGEGLQPTVLPLKNRGWPGEAFAG